MLDEKKIRVMTRLAAYEEGTGKRYMPIGHYFRTDYICIQLLKSFIYGTIAFAMIVGVMLFYNFELIIGDVYNMDLVAYLKRYVKVYAICMIIYLVITYVYSVYRYSKAKKSLRSYDSVLEKLNKQYYEG